MIYREKLHFKINFIRFNNYLVFYFFIYDIVIAFKGFTLWASIKASTWTWEWHPDSQLNSPTAFDQFMVIVISTTVTFSSLTNFVLVLWTKFLKKINKKTTYKTSTRNLPLYFSLVLC